MMKVRASGFGTQTWTQETQFLADLKLNVKRLIFLKDFRHLVIGHGRGAALIWDVSNGAVRREFDTRTENDILTVILLASPDGQTLAFAHTSQISLWDINTGLFRVIGLDEESEYITA